MTAKNKAMILAAGLGTRMRSHAPDLPKPLVPVAGKPLLAYTLDLLRNAGITSAVVNTHYMAEKIEAFCAAQDLTLTLSHEPELLETGGGVTQALPLLAESFFVSNSDVIVLDVVGDPSPSAIASPPRPSAASPCSVTPNQSTSVLREMRARWDDAKMDALLLLIPLEKAVGYEGQGDFCLNDDGTLAPKEAGKPVYVFTGTQRLHKRFLSGAPAGQKAFSLGPMYRAAMQQTPSRIYGMVHTGQWFHVGDGAGVSAAEKIMGA